MAVGDKIELENFFPFLLRSISAHISHGTKTTVVGKFRIGTREWRILALGADLGIVTAKDVSYHSGMDKASISRALDYLSKNKLIERTDSGDDWRSKPFKLTKQGEKVYGQIASERIARAERMWSSFSKQERKELIRLLKKLRRNVYAEIRPVEK